MAADQVEQFEQEHPHAKDAHTKVDAFLHNDKINVDDHTIKSKKEIWIGRNQDYLNTVLKRNMK